MPKDDWGALDSFVYFQHRHAYGLISGFRLMNGAFQKFSRHSEGSESPLGPQPSFFCQVKDLSGKGEVPWGEVLQDCGVYPPVIRG